jgi:hypothetical protein
MATCLLFDDTACGKQIHNGKCIPINDTYGQCKCAYLASGLLDCSVGNQDLAEYWLVHQIVFCILWAVELGLMMYIVIKTLHKKEPNFYVTVSNFAALGVVVSRFTWAIIPVDTFAGNLAHTWDDYFGTDCGTIYLWATFIIMALHANVTRRKEIINERKLQVTFKSAIIVVIAIVFAFEILTVILDYADIYVLTDIYNYTDMALLGIGLLGLNIFLISLGVILRRNRVILNVEIDTTSKHYMAKKNAHRRAKRRYTGTLKLLIYAIIMDTGLLCIIGLVLYNISGAYMDSVSGSGYFTYYTLLRTFELITVSSVIVKYFYDRKKQLSTDTT